MPPPAKSPWPHRDEELRQLHDTIIDGQPLSWAEIAERMGLSKYAVKVHARAVGIASSYNSLPGGRSTSQHRPITLPPLPVFGDDDRSA